MILQESLGQRDALQEVLNEVLQANFPTHLMLSGGLQKIMNRDNFPANNRQWRKVSGRSCEGRVRPGAGPLEHRERARLLLLSVA